MREANMEMMEAEKDLRRVDSTPPKSAHSSPIIQPQRASIK